MRVAIYGRLLDQADAHYIQTLFDELAARQIDVVIFKRFGYHLEGKVDIRQDLAYFTKYDDIKGKVDYLLSIGGDGSLLDTITLVRDSKIPVMGINTGRLGFLSSIGKEEISRAVKALTEGSYVLDKKELLHLDSNLPLFGDSPFALNEFTVHKRDIASMIVIHTFIDGKFVNSYWCDGLIVATPTGSTAYSLSCGGPVILPSAETFAITPIAPHHLNVRPIVVPDTSVITLELESRHDSYLCSLDSRSEIIDSSHKITLRKESFSLNLVRLDEDDFMTTLRNKLMWGFDKRNN